MSIIIVVAAVKSIEHHLTRPGRSTAWHPLWRAYRVGTSEGRHGSDMQSQTQTDRHQKEPREDAIFGRRKDIGTFQGRTGHQYWQKTAFSDLFHKHKISCHLFNTYYVLSTLCNLSLLTSFQQPQHIRKLSFREVQWPRQSLSYEVAKAWLSSETIWIPKSCTFLLGWTVSCTSCRAVDIKGCKK